MRDGNNPRQRTKVKKIEPYRYHISKILKLPPPKEVSKASFISILKGRRTKYDFDHCSLQDISNILWHSAKVKMVSISPEGNILTSRPSPSAGAIHPIDILVSIPNKLNQRLLYYYNPFKHELGQLDINCKVLTNFLNHINNNVPLMKRALFWFIGHKNRTNAKYYNSESLIWRDAGALLMTCQLTATWLKLNSVPIGTLAKPFISQLLLEHKEIISAGGLVFGKSKSNTSISTIIQ
ncbi:MAG: nitroreductase family protein [Candidatus Pacearchaeota archaeon]